VHSDNEKFFFWRWGGVERETITLLFMEEQSSDDNFNQKKILLEKNF
jgi:hypothetical protein